MKSTPSTYLEGLFFNPETTADFYHTTSCRIAGNSTLNTVQYAHILMCEEIAAIELYLSSIKHTISASP
jgi:hypothetical protein